MFKKLPNSRVIFIAFYVVFLAAYIIIGLQPAEAASYKISSTISIPTINLNSGITKLTLENGQLNIPDNIIGEFYSSRKNILLLGHSTTSFQNLEDVELEDIINYNDDTYQVSDIKVVEKESIKMTDLLKSTGTPKITLMTCAGTLLPNQDATHRLIITAIKI